MHCGCVEKIRGSPGVKLPDEKQTGTKSADEKQTGAKLPGLREACFDTLVFGLREACFDLVLRLRPRTRAGANDGRAPTNVVSNGWTSFCFTVHTEQAPHRSRSDIPYIPDFPSHQNREILSKLWVENQNHLEGNTVMIPNGLSDWENRLGA